MTAKTLKAIARALPSYGHSVTIYTEQASLRDKSESFTLRIVIEDIIFSHICFKQSSSKITTSRNKECTAAACWITDAERKNRAARRNRQLSRGAPSPARADNIAAPKCNARSLPRVCAAYTPYLSRAARASCARAWSRQKDRRHAVEIVAEKRRVRHYRSAMPTLISHARRIRRVVSTSRSRASAAARSRSLPTALAARPSSRPAARRASPAHSLPPLRER